MADTDSIRFFDAQFRRQAAAVNVLIEGTTFMGMFDLARGYCLFGEAELPVALEGWEMLDDRTERFDAPGGTVKRFRTCIARRRA